MDGCMLFEQTLHNDAPGKKKKKFTEWIKLLIRKTDKQTNKQKNSGRDLSDMGSLQQKTETGNC